MIQYTIRRIFLIIPTLWAVVTVVFFLIRIVPGGPALAALGAYASEEQIRALEHQMGLDRPLMVQYGTYLADLCRGDLGKSLITKRPVINEITQALPYTIDLTVAGMVLGILIGVPIGIFTALKRNRLPDYLGRIFSLTGISMPEFYLGILLMYVFSVKLNLFPVIGGGDLNDWGSRIYHLVLPAFTLGIIMTSFISRMTRSSMLNVIGEDYVRTARAKGVNEKMVVYKHALRNALIPTTTVIGLYAGILMGGSVLTEIVYSRAGLGKVMVFAVKDRDYMTLQTVIIIFSGAVFLLNLLTDILYSLIDPRIEYH
ncbi:MAG: ABC transporter permease [Deltaproteobacteria bacterium]|jgi:ABC-type dipeptide/oligopeptide/nickel transport system permease component|nr:ABC transporter permease [Deltaproteobacteria bacterium]